MDAHHIAAIDLIQRFGLPRKGSTEIVAAMNENQIARVLACEAEGVEPLQVYQALCGALAEIHGEREPPGWQIEGDERTSREDIIEALVQERKTTKQSAVAPTG